VKNRVLKTKTPKFVFVSVLAVQTRTKVTSRMNLKVCVQRFIATNEQQSFNSLIIISKYSAPLYCWRFIHNIYQMSRYLIVAARWIVCILCSYYIVTSGIVFTWKKIKTLKIQNFVSHALNPCPLPLSTPPHRNYTPV